MSDRGLKGIKKEDFEALSNLNLFVAKTYYSIVEEIAKPVSEHNLFKLTKSVLFLGMNNNMVKIKCFKELK